MKTTELRKYTSSYTETSFWAKITEFATAMGRTLVEQAMLLYYIMADEDVPFTIKLEIIGALGYLILPLDAIPDAIPVLGFTDDATAITMVYRHAKQYASAKTKAKARKAAEDLFQHQSDTTATEVYK